MNKIFDITSMAVEVSNLEGGKRNMNIGDITEVIGCYHQVLYNRLGFASLSPEAFEIRQNEFFQALASNAEHRNKKMSS
jgi:hypothetical protein